MVDLLVVNGKIADGSGSRPCFKADIAISEGKIVKISETIKAEAKRILNAENLIVSPGFIDNHSHSDLSIFLDHSFANVVEQGITTEVVGHCGETIAPMSYQHLVSLAASFDLKMDGLEEISKQLGTFSSYIHLLETIRLGDNWAFYVGHGSIRQFVMGDNRRSPSNSELETMKNHLRDAMEAGAMGMTTGLIYPPGSCASTDELIELAKVVSEYGGIYCTHLRSEGNNIARAVKEALEIGKRAGVPVHISHFKLKGEKNRHQLETVFKMIDKARHSGIKISADMYPYLASATRLVMALPSTFTSGGIENLVEQLKSKDFRKTVKQEIQNSSGAEGGLDHCGYDGIMVLTAPNMQKTVGKTIEDIASEREEDPFDTLCHIIVESRGASLAAYFAQKDEILTRIFNKPYVMGGTDGGIESAVLPLIHPRNTGTFPRLIKRFVKDQKIVTIEEMAYKLSGLPAQVLGFKSKGQLTEGRDADIAIFDLERLTDQASYANPKAKNKGMVNVIINGKVVVENETFTGRLAGELLKRR